MSAVRIGQRADNTLVGEMPYGGCGGGMMMMMMMMMGVWWDLPPGVTAKSWNLVGPPQSRDGPMPMPVLGSAGEYWGSTGEY
jgi:hypothetical protein